MKLRSEGATESLTENGRGAGRGWPAAIAPHLIIPLVGGGALATCDADAQAPCLPHDGKHQLQTEQTRGVAAMGPAGMREGPVLSSNTSARTSSGVTEELQEAGITGQSAAAQSSRGCSPEEVPAYG